MTIGQLWSIIRGHRTNFSFLNASWTYYPDGDPMGKTSQVNETERLRRQQAKEVMPLIGPLMDQWEGLSNDIKGSLRCEAPTLCKYLDKIAAITN